MLLTDARRLARTGAEGQLIPLAQQDRALWDRQQIAEGVALLSATLPKGAIGPYQLQAAIAAVHDETARAEDTDWPQILALYDLLSRMSDNPMVALNRAIAAAMVHGATKGLEVLDALKGDARVAEHHRLDAVRAHLLELAGDRKGAVRHYRAAAGKTGSLPERNYLLTQAARLSGEQCTNERTGMKLSRRPVHSPCLTAQCQSNWSTPVFVGKPSLIPLRKSCPLSSRWGPGCSGSCASNCFRSQ